MLVWLLASRLAARDGQVWAQMWAPEQVEYVQACEAILQDLGELVPKLPAPERAQLREQLGLK